MPHITSKEAKYIHHSLNVFLTEKTITEEVSAGAGIDIEFKEPLWSDPGTIDNPVEDMLGVFCETEEDAARFKHAFGLRRWEDGQNLRGE